MAKKKYYKEEEKDYSYPIDHEEDFPHTALGIVGGPRDFRKVIIRYNLKTMKAEIVNVDKLADNQPNALFKIKEMFTRKLILGEEIE